MRPLKIPVRTSVSEQNKQLFDDLKSKVGFVPNIYAVFGYSSTALSRYLPFSTGKTSFNNREKEVISLVVSEINNCNYCLAAHTAIAKMNGFSESETLEIRSISVSFDSKIDVLAKITEQITKQKGVVEDEILQSFLSVGYTEEHLIDLILAIGSTNITNLLHNVTEIPIDFPVAPIRETQSA
jgi:uncharacterized peroxidase-related enzyme